MNYLKRIIILTSTLAFINQNAFSQKTEVILKGTTDSSLKFIFLQKISSPLWKNDGGQNYIIRQNLYNKDTISLNYALQEPKWLFFQTSSNTMYIYSQPGDSLTFKMIPDGKHHQIKFSGKNAGYYNYDAESTKLVFDSLKTRFPTYNSSKSIESYFTKINTWLNLKTDFLNAYAQHNSLSSSFKNYCRDEILYGYIYLLYSPFAQNNLSQQDQQIPANYFEISNTRFDDQIKHIILLGIDGLHL